MTTAKLACAAAAALLAGQAWAQSNDIKASIANIPTMADSPEKGVFVDFVKGLDEEYKEGKIIIEVVPFGRAFKNVTSGAVDMMIPGFIRPGTPDTKFPYTWVPEPMGAFTLIVFSQTSKPLTTKDLNDALAKGGTFPYWVEAGGGTQDMFPFPIHENNDMPGALKKLDAKKIDAVIWADEADKVLRESKLKNVHREPYEQFYDIILVPKTPRGEEVKVKLDAAMKRLNASGKRQKLYSRVHAPFEVWQPSEMGW